MINTNIRLYNYYTYTERNEYGQPVLSDVKGQVKMFIAIASQSIQNNILYNGCQYIGITHDTEIGNDYVIEYGNERLKVLYTIPDGRYKTVFMAKMV